MKCEVNNMKYRNVYDVGKYNVINIANSMANIDFFLFIEDDSQKEKAMEVADEAITDWISAEPYAYDLGYVEVVEDALNENGIKYRIYVYSGGNEL
jgi:hypothetical protein